MNADKRVLVLSAFICVHRRSKFLFFSRMAEFRSEFVDGRHRKSGSFAFLAASPIPVPDQDARVSTQQAG